MFTLCFFFFFRGWEGMLGMVMIKNKSEINLNLIVREFFIYYFFYVLNLRLREIIDIF